MENHVNHDVPIKIFFDTEFTDLIGIERDPALISIGLISEDGERCFYAELSDTYTVEACSDFVKVAILPLLDASNVDGAERGGNKVIYARMTSLQCRELLTVWISSFGEPVEFWSDAPQYDWHYILDLFHGHTWPSNLIPCPKSSVPKEKASRSVYSIVVESAFRNGLRRHHALDDSKAIRLGYLSLAGNEVQ